MTRIQRRGSGRFATTSYAGRSFAPRTKPPGYSATDKNRCWLQYHRRLAKGRSCRDTCKNKGEQPAHHQCRYDIGQ